MPSMRCAALHATLLPRPALQAFATYGEFLELGKGQEPTLHPPKPEDFLCIMYTRWGQGAQGDHSMGSRGTMGSRGSSGYKCS